MSEEEPESEESDSNYAPGKLKFRFGSENNMSNSCYGIRPDGTKGEWNDPERLELKETFIEAASLEDAREHFCSTVDEPELHIGRVIRRNPEPETVPRGVNMAGKPYDEKPTMPETKDISDDKIIQIWQECENDPNFEDWFYGKFSEAHIRTGYPYKLVAELPLADVYKYDQWQNTEHPALPAPESATLQPGATALAKLDPELKGRPLRKYDRAQIALAKRAIKAKQQELEGMLAMMKDAQRKLNEEMAFRTQQLRYLTFYLGRNVPIDLIQKGQKADDSEPVCIRQRVLYMAEEVGVIGWNTEFGFDFRNIADFDKWVVKPENLYIIAPEPKCIVFLKPRRSDADYGNPLVSFFMNPENRKVYVLFRNGMTVYRAQLDIDIPNKLFPEEEKFEQDIEQQRESNIGSFWDSDWDWTKYQKMWNARKKWYVKGFTDKDFDEEIAYKTKEEMLAAKAKVRAEYESQKANPKETVPISKWDLERVYERYQEELKEFYFGLAYLQGVFDRTDIFGNLEGKVNLFTGLGLGTVPGTVQYAKLIYDLSESRMLEDKATMSLPGWLKSEAKKVKAGDYIIIKAAIHHGYDKADTLVTGVAQVVKVKAPGMVTARMNRNRSWVSYWYKEEPKKTNSIIHKLKNDDDKDNANSVVFYPWNLPMDKLKFYLDRRADRDKYWDNLLVDLLRLKRAIYKKEVPKVSTISADARIDNWGRNTTF